MWTKHKVATIVYCIDSGIPFEIENFVSRSRSKPHQTNVFALPACVILPTGRKWAVQDDLNEEASRVKH